MSINEIDERNFERDGKESSSDNRRALKKLIKNDLESNKTNLIHERFNGISDETVVKQAQDFDADALEYILIKYKNLIRIKARSYFLIGADREDIVQEGMIGLYKAIRDFRDDKQASFRAFAELCVTRQIITAIKSATRQKHQPLNSYVSLNRPVYDEESERTLIDVISGSSVSNPEDIIIGKEELNKIDEMMGEILSAFELKVLRLYLEGKKYGEIGDVLGRDVKSIDNAIQRIKSKVEKNITTK